MKKFHPRWRNTLMALLLLATNPGAHAQTPAANTLVEPLDMNMAQRNHNFGYSEAEIQQLFNVPLRIDLDRSGLDRTLLKPPPPAGVHPRILFNPEDLPAIRQRSATTACGKLVMGNIRKHLVQQIGTPNAPLRKAYDALANGDTSTDVAGGNGRNYIGYVVLYECFRCLLDDDAAGGKKAAAAVTTLAQIAQRGIEIEAAKEKAKANGLPNDFRVVAQGPTYEGTLGLMYDFTYNWMTDAQRTTVREAIARGSVGMTFIGTETLRSLNTNTSNWIPWSARMMFLCCAIEGEPGYDPAAYGRCVNAMTGFIGFFFDTGEAYEGWGKNFMFMEHLAIMAKRGKDVVASTHLRAAFQNYFIHAMDPWGNAFTVCDSLGGTGSKIGRNADVVIYHSLFPNDLAGEFVYRNQVSGDYTNLTEKDRINTRHPFAVTDPLCCVVFANDFDSKLSWDADFRRTVQNRALTSFSEDTGNLMTRSQWSPDALYLNYLNRSVPGGHRYSDRSHFSIYGLGRYWGIYKPLRQVREHYMPQNRSVVLIDGAGPSVPPAKCVAFQDNPLATFVATDLRVPWNYVSNYIFPSPNRKSIVKLPYSLNSFRLHPKPVAWMDIPLDDMPDWLTSQKPAPLNNPNPSAFWTKRDPGIQRAFRTAGLVRGPHPYVLIVDDIQQDEQVHNYSWGMTLADDLALGSSKLTGTAARPMADVVLNETGKDAATTRRHLLVRVLEAAQLDAAQPAAIERVTLKNDPNPPVVIPKLTVTSKAIAPNFKMLLLPYREGDTLPQTTWNADHSAVTIVWPDQRDIITFTANAAGRTRVSLQRGAAVVAVK